MVEWLMDDRIGLAGGRQADKRWWANGAINEISCTEFRLRGDWEDNKQMNEIESGSHEHSISGGMLVLSSTSWMMLWWAMGWWTSMGRESGWSHQSWECCAITIGPTTTTNFIKKIKIIISHLLIQLVAIKMPKRFWTFFKECPPM